jgi:hypothetical protein
MNLIDLQILGTDSRNKLLRDSGLTSYLTSFHPEPTIIQMGSCTASSTASSSWVEIERINAMGGFDMKNIPTTFSNIRSRIKKFVLGESDSLKSEFEITLSPSGTDAEALVTLVACYKSQKEILNIFVGPNEIGSGSMSAGQLRYPTNLTPSGSKVTKGGDIDRELASRVTGISVMLRDDFGNERPLSSVDTEIETVVNMALNKGMYVILHHNASSKTGIMGPSIGICSYLRKQHPDNLMLVADAAQGRFSRTKLRQMIEDGWVILLTGSKFFQGPPFSGAVIFPAEILAGISHRQIPSAFKDFWHPIMFPHNFPLIVPGSDARWIVGIAARWIASLANIETYYQLSAATRKRVLQEFSVEWLSAVSKSFSIEPIIRDATRGKNEVGMSDLETICSFALRSKKGYLGVEELALVRSFLATKLSGQQFLLGQPVSINTSKKPINWLRTALGSELIVESAKSNPDDPSALIRYNINKLVDSIHEVPLT